MNAVSNSSGCLPVVGPSAHAAHGASDPAGRIRLAAAVLDRQEPRPASEYDLQQIAHPAAVGGRRRTTPINASLWVTGHLRENARRAADLDGSGSAILCGRWRP